MLFFRKDLSNPNTIILKNILGIYYHENEKEYPEEIKSTKAIIYEIENYLLNEDIYDNIKILNIYMYIYVSL